MAKSPRHRLPDAVRSIIAAYVREHATTHFDYPALARLLASEGYREVPHLDRAVKRERKRQGLKSVAPIRRRTKAENAREIVEAHVYARMQRGNSVAYGLADYPTLIDELRAIGYIDSPPYTKIAGLVRRAREALGLHALPKGKHLRTENTIRKQRTYMQGRTMPRNRPETITVEFRPCAGFRTHTICLSSPVPGKAFCTDCLRWIRAHQTGRRPHDHRTT